MVAPVDESRCSVHTTSNWVPSQPIAGHCAIGPDSPYEEMRAAASPAYERMSPVALSPDAVAEAIVLELKKDSGPLRLRVGDDAEQMSAAAEAGPEAYDRTLTEELGFRWHPLPGTD